MACQQPEEIPCLVVSQDSVLCSQLKELLQPFSCKLRFVDNIELALQHIKETSCLLVLSDLQQAEESSALFQTLRELHPYALRILLTDPQQWQSAMNLLHDGIALYSIRKPLVEQTLLHCLTDLVRYARLFMDNQRLQEDVKQQQQEIESSQKERTQEREIGKKIQKIILSHYPPLNVPGFSVSMTVPPSLDVDGNFMGFYQVYPSCLDFIVGDVMGKGLPAALIATVVKTQLIHFATPSQRVKFCNEASVWHDDLLMPDEIVHRVLKEVGLSLIELERFVSLFYGRFDFHKQLFLYVNCGFAAPLYFQYATGLLQELSATYCPLGVTPQEAYRLRSLPFSHHDLFLFYSDGIMRTQTAGGEFFSMDRFKQILLKFHTLDADALRQILEEEVNQFFAPVPLNDTFTIVVVKIPETKPTVSSGKTTRFHNDLSQIQAVRHFIQSCFEQVPGDSEQFIYKMQLCVNEAFCNVIEHAYTDKDVGEIVICCMQLEEGGVVDIADQGCEFDPSLVAFPSFFGDQEHGFGWYIIRELTDQVVYVKKNSPHGWNHLRIFKKYIPCEVSMDMHHKKEDGILVVTFEGDHLDAKNSAQCKEYIVDLIKHKQIYSIILDLHMLKFIDSSGLGTFLSLLKELHAHEGELKLAEMSKTVRTVFELVCMHKIFDIFPTVEDALKAMREQMSSKK